MLKVLKGPQPVYFGRNTFGGAVNFITKDPDLSEYHGRFDGTVTTRGTIDVSTYLEGPIIEDMLSASLSARYYDKDGHYTAKAMAAGLGTKRPEAINGKVLFEPNENFRLRLRGAYTQDDDGAPAAGYVSGPFNDSCTGQTLTTNSGFTIMPVNYFCGQIPDINDAVVGYSSQLVDNKHHFANACQRFLQCQSCAGRNAGSRSHRPAQKYDAVQRACHI